MADNVDQVIIRTKVTELRRTISQLATELRNHIRASGDAHPLATTETPGFMSAELYAKLLSYQGLIDELKATIKADEIPAGSMFWYYSSPTTVPDNYVLCDGNNGTLSFSDRFALGTNITSEIGDIGGENSIHDMPLPRHNHKFKNYVDVEISSELNSYTLPSNSNVKMIVSNNKLGWECGDSYVSYPCCYTDYTQYAGKVAGGSSETVSYNTFYSITTDTTFSIGNYSVDSPCDISVTFNTEGHSGRLSHIGKYRVWYTIEVYNDGILIGSAKGASAPTNPGSSWSGGRYLTTYSDATVNASVSRLGSVTFKVFISCYYFRPSGEPTYNYTPDEDPARLTLQSFTYTPKSNGGSNEGQSVNIKPPCVSLYVIKRQDSSLPNVEDGVGTLRLYLDSKLPIGVYSCDGQQISTLLYPDVLRYARNSNLLKTQAEYTSALNTYGSVPYFVYDESNNLLRLPTIRNVIRISNDGSIGKSKINDASHVHGLGDMRDNNGVWGRHSYTATYPTGTTGYFWNGSGSGGNEASPVYAGSVITSYDMNLGDIGNGYITHSTNCVVGIRIYHSVESLSIISSEDIGLAQVAEDELNSTYSQLDLLGTPGFHIEPNGLSSAWGNVACSSGDLSLTLPITFAEKPIHADIQFIGDSLATAKIIDISENSIKIKITGDFESSDNLYYKVYGRLEVG